MQRFSTSLCGVVCHYCNAELHGLPNKLNIRLEYCISLGYTTVITINTKHFFITNEWQSIQQHFAVYRMCMVCPYERKQLFTLHWNAVTTIQHVEKYHVCQLLITEWVKRSWKWLSWPGQVKVSRFMANYVQIIICKTNSA